MIGTTLGPYRILDKVGAGGMGEVYRARDTTLNRDVAIKILPEAFASDADRLARFTREAQALAALNHPNIAQVYAIEGLPGGQTPTPDGARPGGQIPAALVMELVEGDDLSALIARGPMAPADVLPIARQLADALEAAHEAGIVHRDLKPANVKVRADGTVKVLDFGLAKATDPAGTSNADAMNSPTLTARATQLGVILGTAAYMAPEQAKGKAVDKRADIWAFGVVLYEMLTGRRAFEGDDISTTLAAVLMRDPDWSALPGDLPPLLDRLLRRCLERDPRMRLRDIGEARVGLADPDAGRPASEPTAEAPPSRPRAPWLVAAAGAGAAVIFGALWIAGGGAASSARDRLEASLAPPANHRLGTTVALAPDGRRLVMEAVSTDTGMTSLWLRDLAAGPPAELPGTAGAIQPFWSPSGTEIAFFAEGKLKRIDLEGSPPQVVCDAPSARGGTWGPDGTIVFSGTFREGLQRVDADGGVPTSLTTLDETRQEKSHRWPVFLPDGRHILFLAQTGEATSKDDASTIEALALDSGTRTPLVTANSSPLYAPEGFLLFWREGALRGQAFDADRLEVSGSVFSVAAGVAFDASEYALASVSTTGRLVYSTANTSSRSDLRLLDRSGRLVRMVAESVLIEGGISLSHDGTRLAAAVTADGARDTNIWVYDLVRGTTGPLTFAEGNEIHPAWSADDTQLLYSNDRQNDGIVFRRSADGRGQPEQIAANVSGLWPWSWSRDGRWLVASAFADDTGEDLWRYDLGGDTATPLVQMPYSEWAGALSPDDRWLAYQSDETGRPEVYVQSLGPDAGRWQISTTGGTVPVWRGDGRELYFVTPQGGLMAVEVDVTAGFRPGVPQELFRVEFRDSFLDNRQYWPMPDGQQFVVDALRERGTSLLTLVTDWPASAGGTASPGGAR